MTVAELITELQKHPPDMDVVTIGDDWCGDPDFDVEVEEMLVRRENDAWRVTSSGRHAKKVLAIR